MFATSLAGLTGPLALCNSSSSAASAFLHPMPCTVSHVWHPSCLATMLACPACLSVRLKSGCRLFREARRDGHAAADAAAEAPGLFGFINSSLGDRSEAAAVRRSGAATEQQQSSRFGKFNYTSVHLCVHLSDR